jgi:hypothetical protein
MILPGSVRHTKSKQNENCEKKSKLEKALLIHFILVTRENWLLFDMMRDELSVNR